MSILTIFIKYHISKRSLFNLNNFDQTSGVEIDAAGDVVWGYPRQVGTERNLKPEKKCMLLHSPLICKVKTITKIKFKIKIKSFMEY